MRRRRSVILGMAALVAGVTLLAWTCSVEPPGPGPVTIEDADAPDTPEAQPDRVRRTPRRARAGTPPEEATQPTDAEPTTPKRTLFVQVVDEDGTPAAGVELLLGYERKGPGFGPVTEVETNADGRAQFEVAPTGEWLWWWIRAVGPSGTASERGIDETQVRLTLVRDVPITGRVLVRGGPPVADADIIVSWFFSPNPAQDRTDAEGRFRVRGVPPSAFKAQVQVLVLTPSGRTRTTIELDPGPPPDNLEILVDPICMLVGTCVDTLDEPIAGATVTVGMAPGHSRVSTRTDEDGRFVLEAPQGTWALMAQAPGKELFIRKGVDCSVPRLDAGMLVLQKERTCIVRGIILHNDGRPVVGADVTTGAGRGHTTRFAAVKTDGNGRFELETTRRSWVVMVNGYVWSKKIDFDVPTLDVGTLEGSRERR